MNALPLTSQCHLRPIRHFYVPIEPSLLPFLQIAHQTIPLHTPFLGKVQLVVVGESGLETKHLNQCSLHTIGGLLAEMQSCLDDLCVVEHHQGS